MKERSHTIESTFMADDELPVYYSDGVDPVTRAAPDELFLIIIEAEPEKGSDEYGQVGGAFVNCWLDLDTLAEAERRAVEIIESSSWRPYRFDSWQLVTRDTYANEEPNDEVDMREVIEAAYTEGEACVFHTWPLDADDEDE
jgi:hypothetical protein